jgi:signal transduction histidine kinase
VKPLSVRARFLFLVLLGIGLPMAILGVWLTKSTRKSGEALLRDRLDESLTGAVYAIGNRWVDVRSALARFTEHALVRAALQSGRDPRTTTGDQAAIASFERAWLELEGVADQAALQNRSGEAIATFERASRLAASDIPGAILPLRLPVFGGGDSVAGVLEFRVRLSALLPDQLSWSGLGGAGLALFDTTGTVPLLPTSMDPSLFRRERFRWSEGDWLVRSRQLEEPPLLLSLAAPMDPFARPFARAAREGTIALILVLSGALALTAFLTRRITGPLEELADGSDAVAAGNLERQVIEQGPAEIRRVGRAFNAMTESLRLTLRRLSQREAVAAVGEFAASLAHEIRNPLTAIRLDLENAARRAGAGEPARGCELIERAIQEIDRLDSTLAGSLRIARSGDLELTPVDVSVPLRAAIAAAWPRLVARCVKVEAPSEDEIPIPLVSGNAAALEQLLLNLLLNSAAASEPGSAVKASVEAKGDTVVVAIVDTGRGIPPEQLPRVFEPFFTTTEGGTGLGLAIARRIAEAHGSELRLESEVGKGTIVRLALRALPALREP